MEARKKLFFLTVLLLNLVFIQASLAQSLKISGSITDETGKPVPKVNVYIGNTSLSTIADDNGHYVFPNLNAGSYTIVTSYLGRIPAQVPVTLTKDQTVDISLKPQIIELPEVNIKSTTDRPRLLAMFKRHFIGYSEYSGLCKIINEDALRLRFEDQVLKASTKDFLVIENAALGYKIKFLINDYTVDLKAATFHYNGTALFEDLKGTERNKKNWAKVRNEVFESSFKGFLNALAHNRLTEEGFIVRRYIKYDNPDRPSDSTLAAKNAHFRTFKLDKAVRDSFADLSAKFNLPKKIERVVGSVLTTSDLTKPSKEQGLTDLVFDDYIYVICRNRRVNYNGETFLRTREARDYQVAIIKNKDINDPLKFTSEGLQISKGALFFDGAWADPSIAKFLPNDYLLDKK
nr:carboxypeptidase-like regulatory domain-containing protein [uncultured Mucilaginibacter sp.]